MYSVDVQPVLFSERIYAKQPIAIFRTLAPQAAKGSQEMNGSQGSHV